MPGKSLMYTLYKAGPRMDPCRTPSQNQLVGTAGDHAYSPVLGEQKNNIQTKRRRSIIG